MDFPPRLTVDPDYQDMMRQEFRRVAARVKYTPIAEYFPSKELDLWSRDGVHLSDSAGMPILVGSIWNATYMQLVPAEPKPSPVVHRRSPPARRVTPRVIVKGEVAKSPQLDPSKWTVFGQGRKRSQHDEPEQSIDALKQAGTVQQEELEESYLPLTPVWFSSAMLVEMDKISPSHLPGPDECTPPVPKRQKKAKQRAPASKRTLAKRQGEAAPMVVEVIYGHLPVEGQLLWSSRSVVFFPLKSPLESLSKSLLKSPLKSPLESLSKSPLEFPLKFPLESPLKSPLKFPLESPFKSPLESPLEFPLESPLESLSKSLLKSPLKSPLESLSKSLLKSLLESPLKFPLESPFKSPLEFPLEFPLKSIDDGQREGQSFIFKTKDLVHDHV
ncbi:hypothetical protein F7725_021276 [Dissostichus mawsoni]|uniref:Uncharacterized protein n=1 Tax=Dissostichus mawsoni TaxID=36200 RepID=A0A7J5YIY4_DISMA|nr:hypothetical protein F7725_021276 [Dissostichus mawsoni]